MKSGSLFKYHKARKSLKHLKAPLRSVRKLDKIMKRRNQRCPYLESIAQQCSIAKNFTAECKQTKAAEICDTIRLSYGH